MLDTIAAYIDRHSLLPSGGKVIVAVSGGADSLCLLHLLHQLCGPGKRYAHVQLHAAHLNHQLRGEASARDAAAVASIVESWGLPLTIGKIDVPALAKAEHRSLEDAARIARYRFLREVAQGQPIAVAHHADDQVETLLLHWLRGSGLSGMVGMLPRQQDIIRPLLEVSHAQTTAYCQEHDIVPVEDLSNADAAFLRNRIRHQLLPLMESINPGFRDTLLRNAGVLRTDLDYIETQVDACWPQVVTKEQDGAITLNAQALIELPLALQRHLLRRVAARLCQGQSPLEIRHYALIEDLLHRPADRQERTLHLPQNLRVTRILNNLTFERLSTPEPSLPVKMDTSGESLPRHCKGGGGADVVGGPLRSPNRHQPKLGSQAGGRAIRRGESSGERKGGPLWSPAGWGGDRVSPRYQRDQQDAGDHKGPPNPTSAALAPTDVDEPFLRLMRIGGPSRSPGSPVVSEASLPLPGELAIPGTPWIARAELLIGALMEEVKTALRSANWPEVWRLLANSRYVVYVDAQNLDTCLQVRTRRPGDRIQPLGMTHEKKVQDILVDYHIARPEREFIPLFFSASHCIWLAGLCLDERVRLTSNTEHVARLSIIPKAP